jgi:ABC-type polysaccharide/polyol phosphate export permease
MAMNSKYKNIFFGRIKKLNDILNKENREILFELVRANFKVSDYGSLLGISWSFIGPIAVFLVMYFVFNWHFGSGVQAYPLYLLLGVILVNSFTETTSNILKTLYENRDIILCSAVPREYYIISNFTLYSYKFLIEISIIWVLSLIYGYFRLYNFLLFLPLLASFVGLVLGIGFIIIIIYCFIRDTEHIWMLLCRLLFFITPIFYSLKGIHPMARQAVYWLNPLTPFLESFRQLVIGTDSLQMFVYLHSIILGVAFLLFGYALFTHLEAKAMERI